MSKWYQQILNADALKIKKLYLKSHSSATELWSLRLNYSIQTAKKYSRFRRPYLGRCNYNFNVNILTINNKLAFLERAVTEKLIIIKNSRMECFCRDLNEIFDLKKCDHAQTLYLQHIIRFKSTEHPLLCFTVKNWIEILLNILICMSNF